MKEATSSVKRRKPAQSRARATAEAIQQAFVQLLVEHGYERVSIRQVISLAGVGIGSFYEYFSDKEALAAVCIHLRVKQIAGSMQAVVDTHVNAHVNAHVGAPLPERIDALLEAQIHATLAEPGQWSALFLLERRVSGTGAFRKLYGEFVQLWAAMLAGEPEIDGDAQRDEAAFAIHSMIYGLVSQALMTHAGPADPTRLRALVRTAVHGYVSVLAPRAYRLFRFPAA